MITRKTIRSWRARYGIPSTWTAYILPKGKTVQFQNREGGRILVRNVSLTNAGTFVSWPGHA